MYEENLVRISRDIPDKIKIVQFLEDFTEIFEELLGRIPRVISR